MKLDRVTLHRVQIPLKTAFKHARAERSATDAVIVALHGEGLTGYGEILPRLYVTGETIEGVWSTSAPELAQRWMARSYEDATGVRVWLESELGFALGHLAAFSGFELALLDLAGQRFSFSLGEVLGGVAGPELPAGIVIGFEVATEALAKHCAFLRLSGRRHVKVKVGLPDDRARLGEIARVLGDVPLRLDANGEWSADQAIAALKSFEGLPIASIEQPVAREDLDGLRRVREESGVAVMADESVASFADAERLIAVNAADIFNIRLGKNGGLLGSLRIVRLAQTHRIRCNLGTLVGETGLLSRASEVFGRHVAGFECLDGRGQNEHLLSEDILEDPKAARRAEMTALGLGVVVSPRLLEKYSVDKKEIRA